MIDTIVTSLGELTLTRTQQAEPFRCERCVDQGKKADKKAKIMAFWRKPDGTVLTICNGCYGRLLALENNQ